MAAAPIAGVNGSFSMTGHNGRFSSFQITSVQDVNDASGFGLTGNWRENVGGMKGYRISAAGFLTDNAATTTPNADFAASGDDTGVTWTGTLRTGTTYSGTAIASSFLIGHGINGNATFTLDAIGTGALSETWDETA